MKYNVKFDNCQNDDIRFLTDTYVLWPQETGKVIYDMLSICCPCVLCKNDSGPKNQDKDMEFGTEDV